jgi:hypothetical protein
MTMTTQRKGGHMQKIEQKRTRTGDDLKEASDGMDNSSCKKEGHFDNILQGEVRDKGKRTRTEDDLKAASDGMDNPSRKKEGHFDDILQEVIDKRKALALDGQSMEKEKELDHLIHEMSPAYRVAAAKQLHDLAHKENHLRFEALRNGKHKQVAKHRKNATDYNTLAFKLNPGEKRFKPYSL